MSKSEKQPEALSALLREIDCIQDALDRAAAALDEVLIPADDAPDLEYHRLPKGGTSPLLARLRVVRMGAEMLAARAQLG